MRGVLMFAHNNGLFDYGKMAYASALAAMHYLDVPVSLVTDNTTWDAMDQEYNPKDVFDEIVFTESVVENQRNFDLRDGTASKAPYYNTTRLRAYELSPYDETILLDTDVLIQDSGLSDVWGSKSAIRMNHEISELNKMSRSDTVTMKLEERSLKMFWATICYFRRCPEAEQFFEVTKYVIENYAYFGVLYGFPTTMIRVDFVMTVAAHIMSGYVHGARSVVEPLPQSTTVFAWNKDIMVNVKKGAATFVTNGGGQMFPVTINRTVHCTNKDSMMHMIDRIIECYA